jgi:hypothetical protein
MNELRKRRTVAIIGINQQGYPQKSFFPSRFDDFLLKERSKRCRVPKFVICFAPLPVCWVPLVFLQRTPKNPSLRENVPYWAALFLYEKKKGEMYHFRTTYRGNISRSFLCYAFNGKIMRKYCFAFAD